MSLVSPRSVVDISVKVILAVSNHDAIIIPIRQAPGRWARYSTVIPEYLVVEIYGWIYSVAPNMPVLIDPVNVIDTGPASILNSLDSTDFG